MSFFDPREFYQFTTELKIDSKERGLISLGHNPLGTQTRFMEHLQAGFDADIHEFVVLKGRQVGCSTISLALDLYWINKYTGLNGALITHNDGARDDFRTKLQIYRAGLSDDWQQEVLDDNRNQLVLKNGSRLAMRVAGTRASKGGSTLGRSGALTLCHSTETAFYGDPDGISSLRASFAEHNPIRLIVWESTANGFNHFESMWREAKVASRIRAIFIGWWANEFYRLAEDSTGYKRYWGKSGRLTSEEKLLIREVKRLYGETIDSGQVAWYRYMAAEKLTDEAMLRQEHPWTEDMAFVATGSAFFRTLSITQAIKQCRVATPPELYRIETGANFQNTRLIPAKQVNATLWVWAEPVPGGQYVLGCDPAYASSEDADFSVVSVWRVWYNRVEQVAEFADRSISTHAVAWVMAFLAGYYGRCVTNLEVNGPGMQVLAELQNLRRQGNSKWEGDQGAGVRQVTKYMRQYLYRRLDSFSKASNIHTKTNYDIKERMMNGLRDNFERGILIIRSVAMVEEMKTVVRDGGQAPAAPGGQNDDRVVGAALAVMCWNDQLRTQLLAERVIWAEDEKTGEAIPEPRNRVESIVQNYMASIGIGPATGVPPPPKRVFRGKKTWREAVAEQRSRGV